MNSVEYSGRVRGLKADEPFQDLPDPVLAGIFAILGISLGQFYNGRPVRGLCWGAAAAALFLMIRDPVLLVPAGIFFLAACGIDAYSTAEEIRNRAIPFIRISVFFWLELMLAISFGTALGITTLVQVLPGASLIP